MAAARHDPSTSPVRRDPDSTPRIRRARAYPAPGIFPDDRTTTKASPGNTPVRPSGNAIARKPVGMGRSGRAVQSTPFARQFRHSVRHQAAPIPELRAHPPHGWLIRVSDRARTGFRAGRRPTRVSKTPHEPAWTPEAPCPASQNPDACLPGHALRHQPSFHIVAGRLTHQVGAMPLAGRTNRRAHRIVAGIHRHTGPHGAVVQRRNLTGSKGPTVAKPLPLGAATKARPAAMTHVASRRTRTKTA